MPVAGLVIENGGSEDQAIAALLHDAIEDQGVSIEEITNRFGHKVAALVDAVTECTTNPKPPWQERKMLYLNKVRTESPEADLISLADKLHNARALAQELHTHGKAMWANFFTTRSREKETLWLY